MTQRIIGAEWREKGRSYTQHSTGAWVAGMREVLALTDITEAKSNKLGVHVAYRNCSHVMGPVHQCPWNRNTVSFLNTW